MSSNIQVQRICQHCGREFIAKTTVTRYCSHRCNRAAYKQNLRNEKVRQSNSEVQKIKDKPFEELNAKEFLTVSEVAQLLNCSVRLIYHHIQVGKLNYVNLSQRATRVKRSDIDRLFQ